MNELISIIVPVYKVEPYIKRCVQSIIEQSYKNIEIILVDDGSPDKSGEICDEFSKKDERILLLIKVDKVHQNIEITRNIYSLKYIQNRVNGG